MRASSEIFADVKVKSDLVRALGDGSQYSKALTKIASYYMFYYLVLS